MELEWPRNLKPSCPEPACNGRLDRKCSFKKSNSGLDGSDPDHREENPGNAGVENHPQELQLFGCKKG